jgi:RNA polymerase sigma factor (sigma-70 family)
MPSWSETLSALREGDLDARDRVVRLVIGALRSFGAYDQRDSWDDVVQDVLLTLLQKGPSSDEDGAAAAWIRRVTTHRYLDGLRREYGRRREGGAPGAGWRRHVPLEDGRLPDEATLDEGLQYDLAGALDALAPRKRRILECKYTLGCTDAEGAQRLGESLGSYKRLVREALGELRRALLEDPKGR